MDNYILSKSTFMRGMQCGKSLYLYKNFFKLRDEPSEEQKALFSRGTDIGMVARGLFPGGVDASPENRFKYAESAAKTKAFIEQGAEVIYEAAFIHEGVLAAIDMLVKKNGKWCAFEVKSAAKITSTYILDASLQYHVIAGTGLPLDDISIVNINSQYVRQGKTDPHGLFNITSIKEEVLKNQEMVRTKIAYSKDILAQQQAPAIDIGEHCFYPYKCDFMGHCWKNIPKDSVFEMAGLSRQEQFELYRSGVKTVHEIPPGSKYAKVPEKKESEDVYVNKKGIADFLGTLRYPLYFMDFETFMPAIPAYEQSRPFQHIPFQYSIHFKQTPDSKPGHFEFLADAGPDPRKRFTERLLENTSGPGTILAYNAVFEKSILKALSADFPQYAADLEERSQRVRDLMDPFRMKLYYHPMMKGSHSIKNVLPALVPELNYNDLSIGNGRFAMMAFERLQTENDMFRIEETRQALLSYCRMDTLAMVKLLETLEAIPLK